MRAKVFACKEWSINNNEEDALISFEDVAKQESLTSVKEIYAKVTFLSPRKDGKFKGSFYRTARVKDYQGNRQSIQLYNKFCDQVEENQVYKFEKLKVGDWHAPNEKWNRLRTQGIFDTKITLASGGIEEKFSDIEEADGTIEGIIVGHDNPYIYLSCPYCGKKCDNLDKVCPSQACLKALTEEALVFDFNVVLVVWWKEKNEFFHVFCFRRHLQMSLDSGENKSQLEDELSCCFFYPG